MASDSADSAVNTKRLIENSINEIQLGNEITAKTTTAIESVISGIKELAESTKEISELSEVQADSMRQLELGVEQISILEKKRAYLCFKAVYENPAAVV